MTADYRSVHTAGELSVLVRPQWLKNRYERIVLISHRRHLAHLDAKNKGTLVFSTDWLAWRQCLDAAIPCLHFEAMLGEWPPERGDPDDIHIRRCNWMIHEGRDMTVFHGISLGRLFTRDVTLACNAFERIWHALNRALERFTPGEVIFHDLRAEHDLLDGAVALWLVRDIAGRHGARLIEQPDVPVNGDPGFSERPDGYGASSVDPAWKNLARGVYSELVDRIFRLRGFGTDSSKILLVLNWAAARNLIGARTGHDAMPALLAPHAPKRPGDLWQRWREGTILVNSPPARLDTADHAALGEIRRALAEREEAATDPVDIARRTFIRQRILDNGRLEERAIEVKRFEKLFHRHRFSRVVIGDATNDFCRLIAETARINAVPVDELPNGMFLTKQRSSARIAAEPGARPVVNRVLSWGPLTERWLVASAVSLPTAEIGYPALDHLRGPVAPFRKKRVLVLPIYADADDAMAFTSNIFGAMVDIARALLRFGCEIRIKVHVGPQNLSYYRDVLRQAGLDVPIFKDNFFSRHLDWADFVVGPVNSGSFVETLAAGKPYYAICPVPSQLDPSLLPGVRLVKSSNDLISLLGSDTTPDRDDMLEDMCRFVSIPNASRRFWRVVAEEAAS